MHVVGVGGVVLDIIVGFLSGNVQTVMIDGICSDNVSVVSCVSQGSILGPLLFLLYTSGLPLISENTLVSYADNSSLLA